MRKDRSPVRRLLLAAVMVVMTVSLSATAVLAASPSGHRTTIIPYSATYYDPLYGAMVECDGVHLYGPKWPGDATSGGRDVFICRSLSGPFLYLHGGQVFEIPAGGWGSDYFYFTIGILVSNTKPFTVRVSPNNRWYFAVVDYF
jgi:hypothetical protein